MEGYVYIARIIDHGGKFVNGYHKIGLSKQYKVRETQLNSTHLPFDVLMVRVFETENMKKLEGLLHLCFEDYRVVKEYDYRKNITTEWFDVSDIDVFNDRLDKFIELMGIDEVDIGVSIDNDTTMTQQEKDLVKNTIDNGSGVLRKEARIKYWAQFKDEYKKHDSLYDNVGHRSEIWFGNTISKFGRLHCVAGKTFSRVEVYLDYYDAKKNKEIFDFLYGKKDLIEDQFGYELKWERLDNKTASRISFNGVNGNIYDEDTWNDLNQFFVTYMVKLSQIIKPMAEEFNK
jgi:hypothetical protein